MVRQVGFRDDTRVIALVAGRTATVRPAKVAIADKAELAFQRADDLAFSGKHADAIPLYSEALAQRNGRFPAAGIGLARSLMALKQLDEATDAISAVITATPGNAEAQTVSGNILRDRGLYEEAADAYRKAIRLGGGRMPEAHTGLAITLEEQGDLTGAAAEFKTAIAQNGDAEPLLYQLRGGVLERLARSKEALADYRRFLQLAPQHPLAAAVRSVVERLATETGSAQPDDSDVNPYAPKP
jgi:tetratricopeptide (TPR) repeat protein